MHMTTIFAALALCRTAGGLELVAELPKQDFARGERVSLAIYLVNQTQGPLVVATNELPAYPFASLSSIVRADSARTVKVLTDLHPYQIGLPHTVTVDGFATIPPGRRLLLGKESFSEHWTGERP